MFDVGGSELLLIVIVAVVVIGPKDMPKALRVAGRWIGKMRKISGHFRAGIDAMVREAELEEMERKWREQNEAIMKATPQINGQPNPHLPTAEEMQAPVHALPPAGTATAESSTPVGAAAEASADRPAEDAPRQAEMHLPPPAP